MFIFMTYFAGIGITKYEQITSVYNHSSKKLVVNSLHFYNNDKDFNSLL